ncbi:hypothetical protein IFM89_012970 [Coptis chinensis]|uniref:DNA/RNA-binding protein Alba-like domain-containing protein n=1 Tax=Coptis chinensis TaxID=261450 RepID=A0A835HUN3_9MAGN|nr:hypothetical protein IFM89_012970 [Coptis chinensis]
MLWLFLLMPLKVNRFEKVAFSFNGGKDSIVISFPFVLLHLRAGYFLQVGKPDDSDGNVQNCTLKCPIRTIYFETQMLSLEINSFTHETTTNYGLKIETIHLDCKSGLEALLKEKPTKAIFLGTRIGLLNRVVIVHNFILLEQRDTYTFLPITLLLEVYMIWYQICYQTCIAESSKRDHFRPAYLLIDGRLERAGRAKESFTLLAGHHKLLLFRMKSILQDKGSNEIVLKAMGRAINKNVMIAELIKNTSIGSTDITDMWERLWKKAKRIASQRDESCSPQAPHQNGLCGAALGFTLSEVIVTNACYCIFEDSGLLGKSYRNL